MADAEKSVLSDRNVIPDDGLIFAIIGEKKDCWIKIMSFLRDNYRDSSGEWRYYNDGKQWLFKMVNRKKTIFWLGVLSDTFRITFYFGDKAEPVIDSSDLPETIRNEFRSAKKYGAIRPVSIKVMDDADVENVIKLIAIKHQLK